MSVHSLQPKTSKNADTHGKQVNLSKQHAISHDIITLTNLLLCKTYYIKQLSLNTYNQRGSYTVTLKATFKRSWSIPRKICYHVEKQV